MSLPHPRPARSRRSRDHSGTLGNPDEWQTNILPEYGSVPAKDLALCQSTLVRTADIESETEIRYLNHYHIVKLLAQAKLGLMLFFSGFLVVVALALLLYRHEGEYINFSNPNTHLPVHFVSWWIPPVVCVLLAVILILVCVAVGLYPWYVWRCEFLMITNLRFRPMLLPPPRSIILDMRIDDNDLSKVESADVRQSVIGRYLGYGDVDVQLIGGTKMTFTYVKDPVKVKRILDDAKETLAKSQNVDQAELIGLAVAKALREHDFRQSDTRPIGHVPPRLGGSPHPDTPEVS